MHPVQLKHPHTAAQQVIGKRLPRPPIEVGLVPHWLIVDGAQPAIPENAPLERLRTRKRQRGGAPGAAAAAATTTMPTVAAGAGRQPAGGEAQADGSVVRVPVKHVLSQVPLPAVCHLHAAEMVSMGFAAASLLSST